METQTLSYLKQNAAKLDVEDGPLRITQHGLPVYRIYSEKEASMRDEAIALLKLANRAERDIRNGNTMSPEEALKRLRNE
ncbi:MULTISPECIES: type II toxin-antitoxin system Phd/YefM family antitoxin [unclassified Endozoicomonas]|uniref:type II toxin-antitoxin system Phd/YefM family antitoxin n=1 Tax=unclassified Endozoicomonas TaxID=2644528 RepID=UPI002075CBE0|nr:MULTISPECIES: type II toxin-antitoxin system Phd/YefM family antitoxin [unclassified Endozoicomonas]USE37864.1 type II toxin-antitoxin system Phd/YefM family antitoxin [Endozoicomonas sp. SCSIO W0465]WBA80927.1 type II toxin-antitoxin system Phd/YefM family antitoxin [Endozoicomonas sp. GU-1]WBA88494.1 type II toxin-antitoxin system Phd/YefM family antitoxin [Endozoicomonas sp. GU-1]